MTEQRTTFEIDLIQGTQVAIRVDSLMWGIDILVLTYAELDSEVNFTF